MLCDTICCFDPRQVEFNEFHQVQKCDVLITTDVGEDGFRTHSHLIHTSNFETYLDIMWLEKFGQVVQQLGDNLLGVKPRVKNGNLRASFKEGRSHGFGLSNALIKSQASSDMDDGILKLFPTIFEYVSFSE